MDRLVFDALVVLAFLIGMTFDSNGQTVIKPDIYENDKKVDLVYDLYVIADGVETKLETIKDAFRVPEPTSSKKQVEVRIKTKKWDITFAGIESRTIKDVASFKIYFAPFTKDVRRFIKDYKRQVKEYDPEIENTEVHRVSFIVFVNGVQISNVKAIKQ